MAVARASWNRSPVDLPTFHKPATPEPIDYGDVSYAREVLRLEEGQTEAELDKILETQAAQLGISVFDIRTALDKLWESSMCETSTTEVESSEDRIDSSDSQRAPNLTGAAWSNPTNNHTEDLTLTDARRPGTSRRLSFSEYDRYLSMAEEQAIIEAGYTPALKERTLSLLSVSSRKSSLGILVGIKKHFRHRRTKTVGDKLT